MSKESLSKSPWKTLGSKIVYQNRWITVREDDVIRPDGAQGIYGVVEARPGVSVAAMNERNEIYLIKQYRYPTEQYTWEVPAGSSDDEPFLAAAKRELQEETGLIANDWQALGGFYENGGYCVQAMHSFLARGLRATGTDSREEEGITEVKCVALDEVLAMIQRGEITDGQSIVTLMHAMLWCRANPDS